VLWLPIVAKVRRRDSALGIDHRDSLAMDDLSVIGVVEDPEARCDLGNRFRISRQELPALGIGARLLRVVGQDLRRVVLGIDGDRQEFPEFSFREHRVELQGLVKNAEAELAGGRELWEAARTFSISPAAAKLPGAKFKLCAIVDERSVGEPRKLPETLAGVLGFAFEDAVY